MATGTQTMNASLIERVDIHKSCKALETIVNVFNDYCQAAESLSLVQKKLGKALKEAAGLKATNSIASNALNAVAQLMETLAEIDSKFVKLADRECDDASNEVKKWFKKLAKEEKNHDERISATNARIKQAGQQYERKAKKKDLSAAEEHARYVNLLSVVGPEMSQEKYNHSLFVSQRHTSTVYSITSSISRTADAEWQRAYECVRRFSPLIGRIGECRAFLEGGWTRDPPLPLPSEPRLESSSEENQGGERVKLSVPDGGPGEPRSAPSPSTSSVSGHSGQHTPAPAYTPITTQLSQQAVSQVSPSPAPADSPTTSYNHPRPPPSSFPTVTARSNADSVRSIESLSSFPAPPDHFPIPSLGQPYGHGPSPLSQTKLAPDSPDADRLNQRSASGYFVQSVQNGSSQDGQIHQFASGQKSDSLSGRDPLVESPKSMDAKLQPTTPALTEDDGRSPLSSYVEPTTPRDRHPVVDLSSQLSSDAVSNGSQKGPEDVPETMRKDIASPFAQGIAVKERRTSTSEQINEFGQRPQIEMRKAGMERTETVASTSSVVASMRDKLVRGQYQPPSSPREREIPRIAGKVSDLASRYTPVNDQPPSPISPRATGRNSPITDRSRASSVLERRPPTPQVADSAELSLARSDREVLSSVAPRSQATQSNQGTLEDEITARRRRIQELEELERREQAHALRLRERELEHQAFEIQRERERLQGYGGRPRVNSTTTGVNGVGSLPARPHSQYSYSTTNLTNPRGPTATEIPARPVSHYGELMAPAHSQASASSSSVSIPRPSADHAPYCGCYACSAAQYSVPSQTQPQSSAVAKTEKSKGWIRRLSMPVGNAFSSDSKSNRGIAYNKSNGGLPDDAVLKMKPSFERDATGGISNVRPRKLSFGRR